MEIRKTVVGLSALVCAPPFALATSNSASAAPQPVPHIAKATGANATVWCYPTVVLREAGPYGAYNVSPVTDPGWGKCSGKPIPAKYPCQGKTQQHSYWTQVTLAVAGGNPSVADSASNTVYCN